MIYLSVIVPLYNEESLVEELFGRILSATQQIDNKSEIIFIDDGSTDQTLPKLIDIQKDHKHVKIIELSRNFGHQAAYTAGLNHAKGEVVVMLDGDLQDPPEIIPQLAEKLETGNFDIVYGQRTARKEGFPRNILISLFHWVFKKLSKVNVPKNVGNFSAMNKNALKAFLSLPERNRYLPGLRFFIGFKQGFVEYKREGRYSGKAKMSISKLTKLAFDALFSFSKLPIKLSLIIGILGIILSIGGASIVIYKKIIGDAITGWTSTMLAMFFFGSVQLFFLGIMGEYVYRIFVEAKERPIYIVRKLHENSEE